MTRILTLSIVTLTVLACVLLVLGIWTGDVRWSQTAGIPTILAILALVGICIRWIGEGK